MADFGLSAIASAIGTVVSAAGTIAGGVAAKNAADFQAAQLEQQATEEKAAAQREAAQARKERDFIMSRQQAVAASSNLGALDETVLDLAGDVAQQGEYNAQMVQYGGEQRARGRRAQAAAARLEGRAEMMGSVFKSAGTIMGGIGDFASDYGAKKPKANPYQGRYSSPYSSDPWLGYR